jgi:predicted patatin/cPLA2 family phospholipase
VSDAKRNTALVVEGGGLRCAFVAGALSALAEARREFGHVFATSGGAASAAYFVAGQIDRAVSIWQERTHGGQLISPRHWLAGRRLMDIDGLVDVFRGEYPLDAAQIERSSTVLTVALTNCETGLAHHLRATRDNLFESLRATMALPIAYGRVVSVEGVPYIDGSVADSIPVEAALELDPEQLLVITTRPLGYRKKRRARLLGRLLRINYRQYPALWEALESRWERYNRTMIRLEALERQGRVQVIRPAGPLPASRMTRDRARIIETLELGREAAREFLSSSTRPESSAEPIGFSESEAPPVSQTW